MKGIARGIDQQGRLVIPSELLRVLGISKGELVEVAGGFDDDGEATIFVRKFSGGCHLCGEPIFPGKYLDYMNKRICDSCVAKIKK